MNSAPSPGLAATVALLALVLAGGAWGWFSYQQKKAGFEEGSICQRELQNRRDWWTTLFLTYDPQVDPSRRAEAMYKVENANRDEFVAMIGKVDFAHRTGIGRDAICLPDPKTRDRLWSFEEFEAYNAFLKARLNANADLCRKSFEKDVIEYLAAKFPCVGESPLFRETRNGVQSDFGSGKLGDYLGFAVRARPAFAIQPDCALGGLPD